MDQVHPSPIAETFSRVATVGLSTYLMSSIYNSSEETTDYLIRSLCIYALAEVGRLFIPSPFKGGKLVTDGLRLASLTIPLAHMGPVGAAWPIPLMWQQLALSASASAVGSVTRFALPSAWKKWARPVALCAAIPAVFYGSKQLGLSTTPPAIIADTSLSFPLICASQLTQSIEMAQGAPSALLLPVMLGAIFSKKPELLVAYTLFAASRIATRFFLSKHSSPTHRLITTGLSLGATWKIAELYQIPMNATIYGYNAFTAFATWDLFRAVLPFLVTKPQETKAAEKA